MDGSLPTPERPSRVAPMLSGLCLAGLLGWHGWMTLTLFGSLDGLIDDRPVISGKHALHLYWATVGAPELTRSGSGCSYDPAFQAGCPKTPIFSGSRFAEIFLCLGGGDYQPAAYKIGLAAICLSAPLFLLTACWGLGFTPATTFWTTALGLLVWWGGPARQGLEAGDFEHLCAALALLAHAGVLVRFDCRPGPTAWLALLVTAAFACFAHPVLYGCLLPLFLVYYLTTGARHRSATWHLVLWSTEVLGLILNAWWLWDWAVFVSMRSPLPSPDSLLVRRTFRTVWNAPLWGDAVDRVVMVTLLVSAGVGVYLLNIRKQRPAARLIGMGASGFFAITILSLTWQDLAQWHIESLLAPALLFAAPAAAYAWTQGLTPHLGERRARAGNLIVAAGVAVAGGAACWLGALPDRYRAAAPFVMDLKPEHHRTVEALIQHTGREARILWEERPGPAAQPRWTPLLPLLTGRAFIGGFDPDRGLEHTSINLCAGNLAGSPVGLWNDAALDDYCRRYAVGWIAAWSPATIDRLKAWRGASLAATLHDGKPGYLFRVRPETRSLILKGRARVVHADSHHITLADVVPENGAVVLSFHYQRQLVASPARVHIERETDAHDPIGFLRLRMSGPAARVTLTWQGR